MVFDAGARDFCTAFKGEFDGVVAWEAVFFGVSADPRVIDVTAIDIFPPNFVAALAEVPGGNAVTVIVQGVSGLDAAAVDPMDVVAKSDFG